MGETYDPHDGAAAACSAQGEREKAVGFYGKALAIRLNALGPEHKSVGRV